jgi:hypothetical protein
MVTDRAAPSKGLSVAGPHSWWVVISSSVALWATLSSVASACGSSSGSDAGTTKASCQGATATDQKCLDCENTTCASELAKTETDCPGLVSCWSACKCGDQTCLNKCNNTEITAEGGVGQEAGSLVACYGASTDLNMCIAKSCKSCVVTGH